MPTIPLRRTFNTIAVLALLTTAPIASGQMYKCTDSAGKTTYGDTACDAAAQPLKLPADPKGNTTNPSMCAQLLDETRRLDAEADAGAKRGRAETAEHAKQRTTMAKRYAERCVGISRSAAPPK